MNACNTNAQGIFFDYIKNQYPVNLILNPPLHTQLEIDAIVGKLKNIKKDEAVLDFGAGSGRVSMPLLSKGFFVYAIDVSNKSLKKLKKLSMDFGYSKLITSNRLVLHLKYQAIVGADILHHINIEKYLPIFFKSLKKGGKIIFSEPGAFNLSWYIYLPLASRWSMEKGIVQCNYFNLKRALTKYGYRDIKITGMGLFPRPFFNFSRRICIFNDFLGNFSILKFFAYRYIIEAIR